MRIFFSPLLLMNIVVFGAAFDERAALVEEYASRYNNEALSRVPWFKDRLKEVYEGKNIDLVLAARQGNLSVCEKLIEQGVKANVIINAPLEEAIRGNHVACVELFIRKGADVVGDSLSNEATKVGSIEIIKLLRTAGLNLDNGRTLVNAITCERLNLARWLIEQGVSVSKGISPCWVSYRPIHAASDIGDSQMIQFLYDRSADVNMVGNSDDMVPLHFAAAKGHESAMSLLKELGADSSKKCLWKKKRFTAEELFQEWVKEHGYFIKGDDD